MLAPAGLTKAVMRRVPPLLPLAVATRITALPVGRPLSSKRPDLLALTAPPMALPSVPKALTSASLTARSPAMVPAVR
ncbi:hypothetical protein D3C86_1824640 [compost metagenome]